MLPFQSIGYHQIFFVRFTMTHCLYSFPELASRAFAVHRGTLFAPRVNGYRSILSRTIYFRWSTIGATCLSSATSSSIDRTSITQRTWCQKRCIFRNARGGIPTDLSVVNLKNIHILSPSLSMAVDAQPPFNPLSICNLPRKHCNS